MESLADACSLLVEPRLHATITVRISIAHKIVETFFFIIRTKAIDNSKGIQFVQSSGNLK
jgi:hypothetical protein